MEKNGIKNTRSAYMIPFRFGIAVYFPGGDISRVGVCSDLTAR